MDDYKYITKRTEVTIRIETDCPNACLCCNYADEYYPICNLYHRSLAFNVDAGWHWRCLECLEDFGTEGAS